MSPYLIYRMMEGFTTVYNAKRGNGGLPFHMKAELQDEEFNVKIYSMGENNPVIRIDIKELKK